jgi:hypothetical protein
MKKIFFLMAIAALLLSCSENSSLDPEQPSTPDPTPDYNTPTGHNTEPYVSETVELMGIIFRLAGASEYCECQVAIVAYSADYYFASMKDHRAVTLAKLYRNFGVAHDAVTGYANQLIFDDQGKIIFDPDYQEGSNTSFDRWSYAEKISMLTEVNSFYTESNFHAWFEYIRPEREAAIAAFKEKCNMDYAWLDSFYGKAENISSRIILSFMTGGHSHGISFVRKNGTYQLTPVFGAFIQTDAGITFRGDIGTLAHEFSHPYCNPLIDANWNAIQAKATEVYNKVSDLMTTGQAYGHPKIMMYETLVRACTIRYMMSHGYEHLEDHLISYHENLGFIMVKTIANALERYEQESDKYETLSDFMPEIIKAVNEFDPDKVETAEPGTLPQEYVD